MKTPAKRRLRTKCAQCKDTKLIRKDEYRVIERARTIKVRFCSLVCIDTYLETKMPAWFAKGIHSQITPGKETNIHEVRIKPRDSWNPYRDQEMMGH